MVKGIHHIQHFTSLWLICCALFLCTPYMVWAQSAPLVGEPTSAFSQLILSRQLPIYAGLDDPALIDALINQYQSRIDINEATKVDLLWLGLPDSLAQSFLDYRQQYGPFTSLYELAAIPGFDFALANYLRLFFMDSPSVSNVVGGFSIGALQAAPTNLLQLRMGMTDRSRVSYTRQPINQMLRYRLKTSSGMGIGLTAQQDAGEYYRWQPNRGLYGPDFWSGYINTGRVSTAIRQIIVGDYTTSFGHRLVSGAGVSGSRGTSATSPPEGFQQGLMPYRSTAEFGFLRGLAIDWDIRKPAKFGNNLGTDGKLTTYISHKYLDATMVSLQDSLMGEGVGIGGIQSTGQHITAGQLSSRATLAETILGTQYLQPLINSYGQEWATLGLAAQHTIYGQPLLPTISRNFGGQSSTAMSMYGTVRFGPATYSAEAAGQLIDGRTTGLNHLSISLSYRQALSRYRTLSLRVRHFGINYYAPYAVSGGQNVLPTAEQGIYVGIEQAKQIGWTWASWIDLYRFLTPRYRLSQAGAIGVEGLARADWRSPAGYGLRLQYRTKIQPLDNLGDRLGNSNYYRNVAQVGVNVIHTKAINSDYGVIYTHYTHQNNNVAQGWVLASQVNVVWPIVRTAVFGSVYQVQSGLARPYYTEPNVTWYQQLPYIVGTGLRLGGLVRYEIVLGLMAEMRLVTDIMLPDRSEAMVQLTYNLAQGKANRPEILLW